MSSLERVLLHGKDTHAWGRGTDKLAVVRAMPGGAPAGDSVGEVSPKSTPRAHPCGKEADLAAGVADQVGDNRIWPLVAGNDLQANPKSTLGAHPRGEEADPTPGVAD